MANHMPAPWPYDATQRGPVQIKSRHGFVVGTALTVDDARLMAAAPELLAALRAALDQTEDGLHSSPCDEPDCWVESAQAAIAKAEGRTDGR